jgi:hypothetical protein
MLDGSLEGTPENVLIHATSNRRHLMPEKMLDNLEVKRVDDEIHPGEAVEEKISLSERFGLWLAFHPFNQDQYLAVVVHWLTRLGAIQTEESRAEALRYALGRGSRSGRVAWQFARDWAGRKGLEVDSGAERDRPNQRISGRRLAALFRTPVHVRDLALVTVLDHLQQFRDTFRGLSTSRSGRKVSSALRRSST